MNNNSRLKQLNEQIGLLENERERIIKQEKKCKHQALVEEAKTYVNKCIARCTHTAMELVLIKAATVRKYAFSQFNEVAGEEDIFLTCERLTIETCYNTIAKFEKELELKKFAAGIGDRDAFEFPIKEYERLKSELLDKTNSIMDSVKLFKQKR